MADPATTTCARHPDTSTRLFCSECATPICPRCSVATPVGQKCPDCARQKPSATRQGRPRQYAKAAGFGLGAVAVAAAVLPLLWRIPFVALIASFGAGLAVGSAVRRGAEGNQNPPFRYLAVGLAVAAVAASRVWLGGGLAALPEVLVSGPFSLLSYAVAAFGAYQRF